jgi:hypothetical protein
MRASFATRLLTIVLILGAALVATGSAVAAKHEKPGPRHHHGKPTAGKIVAGSPKVDRPAPPDFKAPEGVAPSWAWIEGPWSYQYELDCVTGGSTFHNAYTGYYGATDGSGPLTNTVYYMNVGFAVGGGCAGGVAGSTWASLPRGTSLAVSAQYPVRCMWDALDGKGFREITGSSYSDCHTHPTTDSSGMLYFGTAQIPSFTMYEVWFPVVSTQPLIGSAGPNGGDKVQARVMIGTADPMDVYPHGWIWVTDGQPHQPQISIDYPTDAVADLTCTAAKTTGNLYSQFTSGNAYLDLGRAGHGYEVTAGPVAIASTESAYAVFSNWNLGSEQGYHWRLRYVTNGQTYNGADQTFTTPDCVPPTGNVSINGGAASTTSSNVTLTLAATDVTGVTKMRFANDGATWSTWTAYATTANWALANGTGTRTVSAQFKDAAGNISTAATDSITVSAPDPGDTTPPTVSGPVAALVNKTSIAAGVPIKISWAAATDLSGVARYDLQQSVAGGAWTAVKLATATSLSATLALAPATYRFRVRATDTLSNVSAWTTTATMSLKLVEETATGWTFTGTWKVAKLAGASAGALKYATTSTAGAKRSVTGKSVAIVAAVGPDRGKARISVDGVAVATVDLYAATAKLGQVVSVANLTSGAHTVEVKVLGTRNVASTGTRVDLDALVVLN